MAGSHDEAISPCSDLLLPARIEALHARADGASDGIMVLSPDLTILYATEWVWTRQATINQRRSTCYEAFADRSDPCPVCPATQLFQPRYGIPPSCSTKDAEARLCGMQHIVALRARDGKTECALAFLKRDRIRPAIADSSTEWHRPKEQLLSDHHLGELIGKSAVMQQLFTMIHRVADSQATVLLEGETGTGKELVAKTIHRLSDRRHRPFIVVDCGSLTETLLESELFGHVKGAFTGAVSSKKGLFEEADGGTLFLDEIADTTPHFQSKLLRVIQEGEIKPVGSARSVQVDVRVISATNKDLLGLIKNRTFREDLYYRLAVLPLLIPALRERPDDIPLLTEHFVEISCRRHRRPIRTIAASAMQGLMHAPWLGNVRQLQHAIERAVLTGSGSLLTEEDVLGRSAESVRKADLASVAKHAVQTVERAGIQEALRHADGNKARAARLLNISRASLYTKLRTYGISHRLG
jgi:two-component system, NtrC family, response regulator HydG